jgi:N-acetyl-S-(2-succino)cysteine monooxygenase
MPDAIRGGESSFKIATDIVQRAEQAKIDAIFFPDSAAVQPIDLIEKGDPKAGYARRDVVRLEPMTLLPALAAVTSRIGLLATGTSTYNEPYHIARRFATLDLISEGRGGWNLVTSQTESEAQNFGFDSHMEHDSRYDRAGEFYDVVAGLWDSWDEGAIVEDKESALFFDPSKVHVLNHHGKHFNVRGPLNVARSPQGRPIVVQAGASPPGKNLAARISDVVFTAQAKISDGKIFYDDVKSLAVKHGRRSGDLKILPGFMPVLGRTLEEAQGLLAEMRSGITDDAALRSLNRIAGGLDLTKFPLDGPLPELPVSNGAQERQRILVDMARRENLTLRQAGQRFVEGNAHNNACGTPQMIADIMEEWFEKEACDGFILQPSYYPRGVYDIVTLLVPELQRRGLFRTEYEATTLRGNLGLPVPKSRYAKA